MQLAHAGNQRLAGLGVAVELEGRVAAGEHLQGREQLVAVGGRLRLDRHADDGFGELDAFEQHGRSVGVAERVAGLRVLEPDRSHDVAAGRPLDLLAAFGEHAEELGDIFLLVATGVEDARAGLEHAGIDADEVQVGVGLGDDLEDEGAEGLAGGALAADDFFWFFRFVAGDRGNVERGRQVIADGVEHGLHADVAEGRAAQDGLAQTGDGALA